MISRTRTALSALFGRLSGSESGNHSPLGSLKRTRRRAERRGRAACPEQLESRQLLTGLSFDSVITTESNWPDGKSYGSAVAADAAGNTYMGGFFQGIADFDRNAVYPGNPDILTARGTGDAFLAKYGPSGQFLWARRMGGDSTTSVFGDDEVRSIAIDTSGNVFLTGIFEATADFGSNLLTSAGGTDSYIAKVDPTGNFLWTTYWGTAGNDATTEIAVDVNGNATVVSRGYDVVLPGKTTSNAVRQFDTHGSSSWISDLESGRTYNTITNDASGNLLVSGFFSGTVDLDPGPGKYMVTGLTTEKNSFISKISPGGTLQWATRLVADTSVDSTSLVRGSTIAVGNDGTIAILGDYQGDVRIGEGVGAFSLPSTQSPRTFFARLDPSTGDLKAVKVHDRKFTDGPLSLIATKDGYAVTGPTVPNVVFNPVPGISLASKGERDIWIMTLDQTGSAFWAGLVGGGSVDISAKMSSDGNGGVLITGYSASPVFDFDPHLSQTYDVTKPASFVLKLKPTPATKFYVVDDASVNRTFEYAADSSAVENYTLNSGNAAPRGAASTVAGDKVWVVDANKNVYVYNDSGVLLGSWTAGSLASKATVEGIATNGTDVWLVDAGQDRVYRYANAAGRLSGSQNAISNFALNTGNLSPKDLVTDGTNIWVVNDSTTDKIFKYTLSGSLVGSWTIDSANKAPTGLTIDPSGASQNIWIVDNGTDRVYEYANGRSSNSGSQAAAATFALTAGNTNPQGIADPPATASAITSSVLITETGTCNVRLTATVPSLNPVSVRGQALRLREQSSLQQLTGTSISDLEISGVKRVATADFINDELTTSIPSTESQSSDVSSLDSYFSAFDSGLEESPSNTLESPLTSGLKKRMLR